MDQVDNVLWDNIRSATRVCLYIAPGNRHKIQYICVRSIWMLLCFSSLPCSVCSVVLLLFLCELVNSEANIFQMIFIAKNIEHFAETFDAVYYFACVCGTACQIVSFALQNRMFCKLNTHFQENILRSNRMVQYSKALFNFASFPGSSVPCYAEAEKISSMVSSYFLRLVMITAALVVFPALVMTLIRVLVRQEGMAANYTLPAAFELFFEVVDWPTYLLAFLWQFSNTFAIAYTKKIVSVAFYIDCFQAIAVMRDLQLMAGEFNQYRFVFRCERTEWNIFSKYVVPGQKAFGKRKRI